MNEQMKKPGVGIGILGFFFTLLMVVALLADGLLLGLKTTIFSGSDMVDVLKNANLFETVTEVVVSEITTTTGNDMVSDMAESLLSEEILAEMTENVTEAIKNDEDVDLSGMKDVCMEEVKTSSNEMMEKVIGEIEATGGEINAETLAGNTTIQEIQAQYGIDVSAIVLDYMDQNYGTTSVKVEDVDLEAVKSEARTTVEEVVVPAMEEAVDEYIVELNKVVNEEIRTITKEYDISGMLTAIETFIATLAKVIMVLSVAAAVILVLEILIYLKYINRAFRNVGIATVISGSFVSITGGAVLLLKNLLTGFLGGTGDKAEQVIVNFIDGNISAVGSRILVIGCSYIVVAIVCFVLAGILKKRR